MPRSLVRPTLLLACLARASGMHAGTPARPAGRSRSLLRSVSANEAAAPYSTRFGDEPPQLSLVAPGKINLFLRILKKREDGFHELASLFQTVSLFDTLDFWEEPADPSQPLCSMEVSPDSLGREGIPTDGSNLVMRALALYAERTGRKERVHCRLHKRLPAQAGMGGGSGDAATALHAANRLAGYPVAESSLIEWAGELGSDIGFFFSQGSAYCTGRGEFVENVPPLAPTDVYLVKPSEGCSTPAIFKALGLRPGQLLPGPEPRSMLAKFAASIESAPFLNDLEPPAFEVMPLLRSLRDDLQGYGFGAVMMSGSGSTIFCIGQPSSAADWKREIRDKYDVEIYDEAFCRRGGDEKLWYDE